ncbi:NYN domain-containing protein [Candidatus Woesearchaeota archaeon]|nr:NYN domain-containing protein [Candidatus Woesearchaeota archaeon]
MDNKAQRVGVFVDVQNMYYSGRGLYNSRVNFSTLLKDAVRGRTLIRAIAYVVRTEDLSKEEFFKALQQIGFELKIKELQTFADGSKKADWDIGIAMDMIELANKLDVLILVSGDGDFVPLVKHLQHATGCRAEVMAFGRSSNKVLKESCDAFIDMDVNSKKYLLVRNNERPQRKNIQGSS